MNKNTLLKIVSLLAISVLVLTGCANASVQAAASTTGTVTSVTVTDSISTTGTLSASQLDALTWSTSGTVDKVNVKVGDTVKAGDVLAVLKSDSVSSDIITAQSDLATAQRALDTLKTSESAKAAAQLAVANAQSAVTTAETAIAPMVDQFAAYARQHAAGMLAGSLAEDFLRHLPTAWDQTIVLPGTEIGGFDVDVGARDGKLHTLIASDGPIEHDTLARVSRGRDPVRVVWHARSHPAG